MPDDRSSGGGPVFSKEHPAPALSSILRIPVPASHPQAWGHGHYPEDATPKCIFLTTPVPRPNWMVRAFGGTEPATRASPAAPGAGALPNSTASLRLKIPEWLPSTSQVTRLQVACRALWPRKPKDCGEKAERRRKNEENGMQKAEIREKRAKINCPSRERGCSEYGGGGGQGGWPARHPCGLACQPLMSWLARRNSMGPTGG